MLKINIKIAGNEYAHEVKNSAEAIALAAHAGFMQAMANGNDEWDMWQRVIEILTDAEYNFIINVPFDTKYDLEVA